MDGRAAALGHQPLTRLNEGDALGLPGPTVRWGRTRRASENRARVRVRASVRASWAWQVGAGASSAWWWSPTSDRGAVAGGGG